MRVMGIGFRAAADIASLQDAMQRALAAAQGQKIDAIVSEASKTREVVFREFAQLLGLPGLGVSQNDLALMITPTQSNRILDQFGTGSLAEAAALVAAGPDARLVAARAVSGDGKATAAIADNEGNLTP
ncbi:MAG: cobalamin biosynthesis protein [Sulfitobacter sp.]